MVEERQVVTVFPKLSGVFNGLAVFHGDEYAVLSCKRGRVIVGLCQGIELLCCEREQITSVGHAENEKFHCVWVHSLVGLTLQENVRPSPKEFKVVVANPRVGEKKDFNHTNWNDRRIQFTEIFIHERQCLVYFLRGFRCPRWWRWKHGHELFDLLGVRSIHGLEEFDVGH